MADKANRAYPERCELCKVDISRSLRAAFDHIRGRTHLQALQDEISEPAQIPEEQRLNFIEAKQLLEIPKVYDFHQELGYDVDQLIKEARKLEEQRLAARALWDEAKASITPDMNWCRSEELWTLRYDAARRGQPDHLWTSEKPPHISALLARCSVDDDPPRISLPQMLPCPLPPPSIDIPTVHAATTHLGIVSVLLKQYRLRDFDLVCNNTFIKTLTGSNICQKPQWLQRCGKTVFCWGGQPFGPQQASHPGGFEIEGLLCGIHDRCSRFYSCQIVRIGNYRILITGEADACNDKGEVVEIKASKGKIETLLGDEIALQLSLNGASSLIACRLDSNRSRLLEVESIPTADVLQACSDNYISLGQRVTMLLDRILSDDIFKTASASSESLDVSDVVQLKFDKISRAPMLKLDQRGYQVLPDGIL